jgi:hypothetical protein
MWNSSRPDAKILWRPRQAVIRVAISISNSKCTVERLPSFLRFFVDELFQYIIDEPNTDSSERLPNHFCDAVCKIRCDWHLALDSQLMANGGASLVPRFVVVAFVMVVLSTNTMVPHEPQSNRQRLAALQ